MAKNSLKRIIGEMNRLMGGQLEAELGHRFTAVPSISCCGKSIVFLYPRTTCICSVCRRKWKLVVEVRPFKRAKAKSC